MTAPARLLIHPDKQSLAAAAAARLITAIVDTLAVKPEAQLALTGGSMGSDVWRAVVASPARGAVDWSRVRVWWGDERYLPAGDPDRNDTQNDAAGLAELGLTPDNVHRVAGPDTSESAEASAAAYAETIRTFGQHEWDVALFGVGPDGHIASLFPGHPAQLTTGEIAIAVHDSPKPPPTRVSLTFECVDRAQRVWFLVAGEDKRQAVVDGLAGAGPSVSSAAQLHGLSETLWLVDAAAAGDN